MLKKRKQEKNNLQMIFSSLVKINLNNKGNIKYKNNDIDTYQLPDTPPFIQYPIPNKLVNNSINPNIGSAKKK